MSDVQRYLNQISYIDQNINSRRQELDNLRKNIPSASDWQQDIVTSSRENRSFVDQLVKIDEDIIKKIEQLIHLKDKISSELDELEVPEHTIILRDRYMNKKTFERISLEMYISERHTKRIHGNALKEFEEKFSAEIEDFIKRCP